MLERVFEWGDLSRSFEQELVVVVFFQILKKVIGSDVVNRYFTQRFLESFKVTSSNSHLGGWYQTILVTYESIRTRRQRTQDSDSYIHCDNNE